MAEDNQAPKIKWLKLTWFAFFALVYTLILSKLIYITNFSGDYLLAGYSIFISLYILVRFGLSFLYEPTDDKFDCSYSPTVTFSIPAKNEEENIYKTILKIAETDYPKDKFNIIAVNDGSTDGTLQEMQRAKREVCDKFGVSLEIIDWKDNRGKREGMAACIRKTTSEIMTFIDSDSFVEKNTLREMIKYFRLNPRIGAVTGHTHVYNQDTNLLTKLQTIHYFISFKVFKSAESLFGAVTCCPGCCSSYRVDYLKECVFCWSNETFLGVRCTYGDDRSLTNYLLKRGYMTVFAPTAHAYTVAPHTIKQFFKQQLRWKKSWTRESILASRFFWRQNPVMSFIFYSGLILTFLAPFVIIRAVIVFPLTANPAPISFYTGLILISALFSLYYRIYTGDKRWYFGFIYSIFYSLFLSWLLLYAIPTLRNQKWGTR